MKSPGYHGESKVLIFDDRPGPYSPRVAHAIDRAMEVTRQWRRGLGDGEFLDQIEADAKEAVRKAFNLPAGARIIFTSSIEEARSTAIKGLAWGAEAGKNRIVTVSGDPAGFEESAIWCGRFGFESIRLPVGKVGGIPFPSIEKEIDSRTAVVALNSVTPEMYRWRIPEIRKLSAACDDHSAELVIDISTEVIGKQIDYDGNRMSILCDGRSLGAPIAVAFLALRSGVKFGPLINGGTAQDGLRGGSLNPALVAGLGAAVKVDSAVAAPSVTVSMESAVNRRGLIATTDLAAADPSVAASSNTKFGIDPHLSILRETALKELRRSIPSASLVHGEAPLPVGLTFVNPGVEGEAVMKLCAQEGVFIATGSDCLRRTGKVSPVLTAAGFSPEEAAGSVQMFFRAEQCVEDVKRALEVIGRAVDKLIGMR